MSNEAAQAQARSGSGPSSSNGWFHVLMELYRVNEQYIQEVVDASRKILHTVLDGLVPGDHLKHAPVRTCFRILSGMIFILKVSIFLVYNVKNNRKAHHADLYRHSPWVQKRTTFVFLSIYKIVPWKLCGPM